MPYRIDCNKYFLKFAPKSTLIVTVFVILGHYYEHLGLMVAMEEKKLFDKGNWLLFIFLNWYILYPQFYLRYLLWLKRIFIHFIKFCFFLSHPSRFEWKSKHVYRYFIPFYVQSNLSKYLSSKKYHVLIKYWNWLKVCRFLLLDIISRRGFLLNPYYLFLTQPFVHLYYLTITGNDRIFLTSYPVKYTLSQSLWAF